MEGTLKYPNSDNTIFQIPYKIVKGNVQGCKLRLNVKCVTFWEDKFVEVSSSSYLQLRTG